ncbi:hypothetical protein R6Q57_004928 [Mikania cordata]
MGDDDQRSSDSLHPPLHRVDHIKSRPEPGVGDDDRSVLSSLTQDWQAMQPGTMFCVILRHLLPPSRARYTVWWCLCHPRRSHQRHG